MRRRLLITYLSLLGVVLVAFLVPLGWTIASRQTQSLFIDRVDDATRFATIAEPALPTSRLAALQSEISEYDRLYGVGVAIVRPDGIVRIASRGGIDPTDPVLRQHIDAALSGTRAQPGGTVWPWQDDPMVVAEPVGNAGSVIGVVVTVSPTSAMRASVWHQWAVLAAVGLLILSVGAAAAVPLTRWLTRPLNELDEATHAISRGELTERVHGDVGPPELRSFAASFNAMADRLATLIERQRGFIAYASHQLRTPLATVRLRVENLGDALPAAADDDHRQALEEVDRLSGIFEALLTFVRTGSEQVELTTVDAGTVADARVAAWHPRVQQSGVVLARSGAETAPALAAGETLGQVLDALLDNALKHCAGRVEVLVSREAGAVHVHVIDDGPGMSDAALRHATEPFWRNPSDSRVAGAGLGLAIVHALITASGGELTLRHARPHGVDAGLRLTAAPPDTDDAEVR